MNGDDERIRFENLPDNGSDQLYFDLKWIRKRLIIENSIADPDITKVEARLLKHPLIDIDMQFAVIARVIQVSALYYEIADDPDLRHRMLLSAREYLHEIQQFPDDWQCALAPLWGEWMRVLDEEERELAHA